MVVNAGAVRVAQPFSVPSKTHGLGAIAFGHREGWDCASLHFVPNSLGLERASLVNTKETIVEGLVVNVGANGAASCAGSRWGG